MDKDKEEMDFDPLFNLEEDDSDNLYRLPDDFDSDDEEESAHERDEENISHHSLRNNSEDDEEDGEEDDEENEDEEDEEKEKKGSPFALMFKILSTPVEGWKELKRRRYTPEQIASGMFFPTIAIAAISEFAAKIYTTVGLNECLMNALKAFISFFFGYFTVLLISGVILPKASKKAMKESIGRIFVMVNMSTLALFFSTLNLFPMIDAVLVFLPIWTIYLIYKGVRILRVPEGVETRTKILLAFLIIGCPFLWSYLMDLFFKLSI